MFIVTESYFYFIFYNSRMETGREALKEFRIGETSSAKVSGMMGSSRKVSFTYSGKSNSFEKIHKENAKRIVEHLNDKCGTGSTLSLNRNVQRTRSLSTRP